MSTRLSAPEADAAALAALATHAAGDASDAELAAHEADTTNVHGITDTTKVQLLDVSQVRTADLRLNAKLGIDTAPLFPLHIDEVGKQSWAAKISTDWNGLIVGHNVNLSAADTNPHDVVDIFLHSTGDGIFIAHQGGVMPAFTFTATTTNGSATLTGVSSFTGLYGPLAMTGTGIPAGARLGVVNVGAATLTMVNASGAAVNATASGSITVSVAQPAGTSGGNAAFNALVPYNVDDATTGRAGSIVNNRQSQVGLFIENQVPNSGSTGIRLKHQGAAPALDITNSDTAFSRGNGQAVSIADYGNDTAFTLSKFTLPSTSNSALLKLSIPGTSPSSPTGGTGAAVDAIRVNDEAGVGRVVLRTNGQLLLGTNYPGTNAASYQLQASLSATGLAKILSLDNPHATTAGDGVQVEARMGGNQWGLIQCVEESGGGSTWRFSARTVGFVATERLRLGLTGVGFNGQVPVQPTAAADATDLASVIALANDIKAKLRAISGGVGLFA